MRPLIVLRPEPGLAATITAARDMGLEAIGFPLFETGPVGWIVPAPGQHDVLLAGSGNVFRLGGPGLRPLRALPVHAVGEATAAAARAAGFTVATTGSGGLQPVLAAQAPGTRVLRLAGQERVALTPPAGVTLDERVVYAVRDQPLPLALVRLLTSPAVVALHSAEAARHFAAECARLGLARDRLALVTIGPRVSAAAGAGWERIDQADAPADPPLLAKARDLCHTLPRD